MGLVVRGFLTLTVLTLLAVTLDSLVFSGANFSKGEADTSASFIAGSVSHTATTVVQGFALNADPIVAGLPKTQTLTINGGPDVPAQYFLTCIGITDDPNAAAFSQVLQLQIHDVTAGTDLHNGIAADFVSANLGVIAPGETRDYDFTLTYPAASADRALMGASMTMDLEIVGVSL
jgi:hypothetical protein